MVECVIGVNYLRLEVPDAQLSAIGGKPTIPTGFGKLELFACLIGWYVRCGPQQIEEHER